MGGGGAVLVNAVHLIGLVASRPRVLGQDGAVGFILFTQRDDQGQRVERHRVVVEPRVLIDAGSLAPGETVYIRGRLGRFGENRRPTVTAIEAWSILPAPPLPVVEAPIGTHASPQTHERRGHYRRVGIGGPSERLTWVRQTTVGSAGTGTGWLEGDPAR